MKSITVNEMIYKTITTKTNKEPKYKNVLEAMGYTVYNSSWSEYDYWAVKNEATNRMIVFSKGYDKKKRLYDEWRTIKDKDFKKVNLTGYLNCIREHYNPYNVTKSKYRKLREKFKQAKYNLKYSNRKIDEIQQEIDVLTKRLEEAKKYRSEDLKVIDEVKSAIFVGGLKKEIREEYGYNIDSFVE